MPRLDLALFLAFGSLALAGVVICILCFRRALRVANKKDGDVKMFFWAVASMLGLIVAGMSTAYILLPIILHN